MSTISKFFKIPITKRAARAYEAFIGSNEGQTAPKGTPGATGESHPLIGSADPSPSMHRLNADYVKPQDLLRKRIALDLLIASNPPLKTALKNFAYDAAGTFQSINVVSAVNKVKTQDIIDQFVKRVKLKRYLAEYFRRALLYGEEYLQHEIQRISSSQANLKQLFYMPIYGMIRCSNELDQFEDTDHAYEQQDLTRGVWKNKNAVGIFPSWAINNIRLFNLPGEPNGFSLFEGNLSSGVNDRLVDLYMEMYLQRKYSTVTDLFILTGPDNRPAHEEAMNSFMDKISKLRRALFGKAPAKDIVMPNGTAQRLPSDANTDKIKDIQLQSAIGLVESHQSPQMLYDDEFANVGVLVEKYRQYNNRQESHLVMFIEEIDESVQFELGLNGIDPSEVELEYRVAQQHLLQDAISINKEAREDRNAGYITEETKIKIGSQLYRVKAETEQEMLRKEKEAKQITDQNNSDETKKLVDKALNNKEIKPRDVTVTEVDPQEELVN